MLRKLSHDISISDADRRKKRVKRMKVAILMVVTTMLILPTICCAVLFFKLNHIQKQMVELQSEMNTLDDEKEIEPNEIESNDKQTEAQPSGSEKVLTSDLPDQSVEEKSNELASNNIKKKQVYLTFDDGPSSNSNEILDILAKYNIKATFFVIGKTDTKSKEIYKRIVQEGHALGMHSYSHIYSSIYGSSKAFEKDITKLQDLLQEVTGVSPNIYRFPGGSSNSVSKKRISKFITYLDENSITYYDWNVVNGDALGTELSQKELINNVLIGVDKHTKSIVLMHDAASKQNTVKSLSDLIEALLKEDVEFLPIDQTVEPIQHIIIN